MKKLKGQVTELEQLNFGLQQQLLLQSKKHRTSTTKHTVSKSNKDMLKTLKRRLAGELSDDGVRIPFFFVIQSDILI